MERAINSRRQGDFAEATALTWLSGLGATVFIPFGSSPEIDLIAELDGRIMRVQVKSSVCRLKTPNGHLRWSVAVATRGGNQSWNRTSKLLDLSRIDYLFALVGDGRQWFIPAAEIEATSALHLGGEKYSEFEIGQRGGLETLVYEHASSSVQSSALRLGEYPSGQRMAPVKRPAQPSKVRILPPPLSSGPDAGLDPRQEPRGQTRVSGNRQIVLPKRAFDAADLARGDRLKAFALGPGEVLFRRIGSAPAEKAESTSALTRNENSNELFQSRA